MENQNNQSHPTRPPSGSSSGSSKFDAKTIATIKVSIIWGAVAALITSVAEMVVTYFTYNSIMASYGQYSQYLGNAYAPQLINIGALISTVIGGAIGGAIAGWVIAKFYPVLAGWQRKYLGNKLNSFFKILFWPYVVILVISIAMTGALSFISSAFLLFLVTVVADVVAAYVYAKMMDKAVGKYYQ
jgi:hypothetical protein